MSGTSLPPARSACQRARLPVTLALAATLGGCGFHLQGAMPLPRTLAVVHIEAADTQSDFYFGLRRELLASGTRIDDAGADPSAAVIHIITDSTNDSILVVSTTNVPAEYELRYTMKFSVTAADGRELIRAEEHELVRDYTYSESAQLAKQREQAILSEALANDLASVVMRRLSSL